MRVASAKPRAVASFEPGASSRCTIIATTRARTGVGLGASSRSSASRCTLPSTAATWPCGQLRTISSPAPSRRAAGGSARPRRTCRKASIRSLDQSLRFARVRFLTLPPSRKLSRSKMAGGDERFGTTATYMPTHIPHLALHVKHIHAYAPPAKPTPFFANPRTCLLRPGELRASPFIWAPGGHHHPYRFRPPARGVPARDAPARGDRDDESGRRGRRGRIDGGSRAAGSPAACGVRFPRVIG